MPNRSERILTSHVGSLPRPEELIELNHRRAQGEFEDEGGFERELAMAVAGAVRRQQDIGIDVINDGEYGHGMGQRYNYGSWWSYAFGRLGGLELAEADLGHMALAPPKPGELALGRFADRRDRRLFGDAYADPSSGASLPDTGENRRGPVCRGPITYRGQDAVQRDIANLKAALDAAEISEGFLNAVAPGSCARIGNEYYATDEEMLFACADAMAQEYRAIVDAGLILQLDDPSIAESWDAISPVPSAADYRHFSMVRVEALNHAISGLPAGRIRFHLCWGSWHGPHVTDIPMAEIVEVMLAVNAGAYAFEAGNARHDHEWKLWRDIELPEGKVILPGVVSHATNVVEHPELVADRIVRYAEGVGRENVIASTDCGLGGRVHPQIAWAKLDALVAGAGIATKRLWA